MKNRKKALIIAMICLAAAAVLYLLVVKMNQKEANSESDDSDDSLVISSVDSGVTTWCLPFSATSINDGHIFPFFWFCIIKYSPDSNAS